MTPLDFRHLAELHRRALRDQTDALVIAGILALVAGVVAGVCLVAAWRALT